MNDKGTANQEADIAIENISTLGYSPIIVGIVAVIALFLVFTLIRKLFGLAVFVALAIGVWMVWNDPALLQQWADAVMSFFDSNV